LPVLAGLLDLVIGNSEPARHLAKCRVLRSLASGFRILAKFDGVSEQLVWGHVEILKAWYPAITWSAPPQKHWQENTAMKADGQRKPMGLSSF
jgi:hypothetical protein